MYYKYKDKDVNDTKVNYWSQGMEMVKRDGKGKNTESSGSF